MKWLLLILSFITLPWPAAAEGLAVPSGQLVLPYEALWEDHVSEGTNGETWLILRFLTPEIARTEGRISFGDAEPDIVFLCQKVGLPLVVLTGGGVDQIIVNLMDRPVARGQRDPASTQFMNAYRVDQGDCIWE
jgi:hypothetical protein